MVETGVLMVVVPLEFGLLPKSAPGEYLMMRRRGRLWGECGVGRVVGSRKAPRGLIGQGPVAGGLSGEDRLN